MGCDIHVHVEYKSYRNYSDTTWRCGDYYYLSPDSTIDNPKYVRQDFLGERSYARFSILADVRNDGSIKCIDRPRGLPDDVTNFVKASYEYWSMDAHSCSYLTLQELIDYHDETPHINHYGTKIDMIGPMIEALRKRADELNIIYDFEWKNGHHIKARDIRIVFWFDN